MNKDEAIHKALKVLNCLNNDRVYETAWVKGAINACKEALKPHPDCDEACMFQCQMEKKHGMTYEQGFEHGYEAHRVEQENDKQQTIASIWEGISEIEQPAQEPVAWKVTSNNGSNSSFCITEKQPYVTNAKIIPLYTHPHQWQGLTAKEITSIPLDEYALQKVEKILKEKNFG